jgi:hypothetical protein
MRAKTLFEIKLNETFYSSGLNALSRGLAGVLMMGVMDDS